MSCLPSLSSYFPSGKNKENDAFVRSEEGPLSESNARKCQCTALFVVKAVAVIFSLALIGLGLGGLFAYKINSPVLIDLMEALASRFVALDLQNFSLVFIGCGVAGLIFVFKSPALQENVADSEQKRYSDLNLH